jgi:hypothetical protein
MHAASWMVVGCISIVLLENSGNRHIYFKSLFLHRKRTAPVNEEIAKQVCLISLRHFEQVDHGCLLVSRFTCIHLKILGHSQHKRRHYTCQAMATAAEHNQGLLWSQYGWRLIPFSKAFNHTVSAGGLAADCWTLAKGWQRAWLSLKSLKKR